MSKASGAAAWLGLAGANERNGTVMAAFNTILAIVEKFSPSGKTMQAEMRTAATAARQQQKRAAHKKKCEMEKHIKRKTEKTLSHTQADRQTDKATRSTLNENIAGISFEFSWQRGRR